MNGGVLGRSLANVIMGMCCLSNNHCNPDILIFAGGRHSVTKTSARSGRRRRSY